MSEEDQGSKYAPVSTGSTARSSSSDAANGKVMIGSIDDSSIFVEAMFNPKELEVTRSVPWQKPNQANRSNRRGQQGGSGDQQGIHLEFTGAEGRSLTLELLFDGYENDAPGGRKVEVAKSIEKLEKMASVRVPGSKKEDEKRPHRCVIVWGSVLPRFNCVIESLSTKYTMFDKDGNPLRATCVVKVKEADIVSAKKK
jgi:hypothetical protein